ncbi:MAG: sugar phosphate isomerase/epimerase family protein [Christensenellales bacterium]
MALTAEMGAATIDVPGAQPPAKYDDSELYRSVEALRKVADLYEKYDVRCAIEAIRSAEVSIVHTFEDAKAYIKAVDRPGIGHINGDLYHMLVEESHIGQAILDAGEMLTNLHLADTNRCALGDGFMDIDTVIRALYLIGYNNDRCFVTPEPLGPGGDPYPAEQHPDPAKLKAGGGYRALLPRTRRGAAGLTQEKAPVWGLFLVHIGEISGMLKTIANRIWKTEGNACRHRVSRCAVIRRWRKGRRLGSAQNGVCRSKATGTASGPAWAGTQACRSGTWCRMVKAALPRAQG